MRGVYTIDELEQSVRSLPQPRLGVVGNPIAHSLSPDMQLAAMRSIGMDGSYVRILCPVEEGAFAHLTERLRRLDFAGINVTVPFKKEALAVADEQDPFARACGAANTLKFEPSSVRCFNTDGAGFAAAFKMLQCGGITEHRVLVLGACGGAGRVIASFYAMAGGSRLLLANRPRPELGALAEHVASCMGGGCVTTHSMNSARDMSAAAEDADVIVNATSLGLSPDDPLPLRPELLQRRHIVFDLITHDTPLQRAARSAGCVVCDGCEMLLQQGALSFEYWFHRPADVEAMRAALFSARGV